jgi:diadenosine tetraphosphate (Ap4A) HIT family hydrolase
LFPKKKCRKYVNKVGKRIKTVLQAQFVGIQVEGIAVPHVHVHVFPFSTAEEFHSQPDLSADPNEESLKEMAEKLAF